MRNSLFDLHLNDNNRCDRLLNNSSNGDVQGVEDVVGSECNNNNNNNNNNSNRCLYGNNVNGCFRYENNND